MADKAQVLIEFLKKVEVDEKILRSRFPQISGLLQVGTVPAAVLQNYMAARDEVQSRMAFCRNLMRQYSDPKTGDQSPDPMPLPAFGAATGNNLTSVPTLKSMDPGRLVSAKEIIVDAPPVPAAPTSAQLGNPVVIIAVIGATLVVTSIAAKFIIDAINEQEVKLAEQGVELAKQKNFATVWDTAQKLISQCVGSKPTPEVIEKCWVSVASRFPAIVEAIPEHKLSSGRGGLGFFGKIGLAAAVVGTGVVGIWGYRKWKRAKENDEDRAEERKRRRAAAAKPSAAVAGAPARKRRRGLGAAELSVGDKVRWTSSSAGITRQKDGEIVEVVPAGARPTKMKGAAPGTRPHVSYIVRARAVGTMTEAKRLYWPLAKHLEREG